MGAVTLWYREPKLTSGVLKYFVLPEISAIFILFPDIYNYDERSGGNVPIKIGSQSECTRKFITCISTYYPKQSFKPDSMFYLTNNVFKDLSILTEINMHLSHFKPLRISDLSRNFDERQHLMSCHS